MRIDKILLHEIINSDGIWLTVHGNSMFPAIADGQKIFLAPNEKYAIGDIVAYIVDLDSNALRILVHRVIFVRKTFILAKGDNNSYIDPIRISYDRIIGIVKKI